MLEHREHGRWVYGGAVTTTARSMWVPGASPRSSPWPAWRYYTEVQVTQRCEWRIRAKHQDPSHPKAVYSEGYGYVTLR
jgi:hypothetical protein